jgi:hypothetical protein
MLRKVDRPFSHTLRYTFQLRKEPLLSGTIFCLREKLVSMIDLDGSFLDLQTTFYFQTIERVTQGVLFSSEKSGLPTSGFTSKIKTKKAV